MYNILSEYFLKERYTNDVISPFENKYENLWRDFESWFLNDKKLRWNIYLRLQVEYLWMVKFIYQGVKMVVHRKIIFVVHSLIVKPLDVNKAEENLST